MESSYSWYTGEMKTLQEKFTTTLGVTTTALDVQATSAKNNSDELFKQLDNTLRLVTATDSFKVSIDEMLPSLVDYTKKVQAMVTELKNLANVNTIGTPITTIIPATYTSIGNTVTATAGSTTTTYKRYAEGGVVTTTGQAILDGSPSSPEVVFNSGQAKKLWELVKNLPNGLDITKITSKSAISSFIPTDFAKSISSVINKTSQAVTNVFNIDRLEFPNITNENGVNNLIQGLNSYALQYSKRSS
jgi:hypothetical protein